MNTNMSVYKLMHLILFMLFAATASAQEYNWWNNLMPKQQVLQYAGNMGLLSTGMGWTYGSRGQWETDMLVGFIPKFNGERARMTFTLKENYIPWSIDISRGWELKPFACGMYVNVIGGHDFWNNQPRSRYPKGYYVALSTRTRFNFYLGQRVEMHIPDNHRKFIKSVIFFYEASLCDFYIRSLFQNGFEQKLSDLMTLSVGVRTRISY